MVSLPFSTAVLRCGNANPGCLGTTGDSSGNLSWGFNPEDMALFPEVEVNTDVSLLYRETDQG